LLFLHGKSDFPRSILLFLHGKSDFPDNLSLVLIGNPCTRSLLGIDSDLVWKKDQSWLGHGRKRKA